jgi:hypothetical protein
MSGPSLAKPGAVAGGSLHAGEQAPAPASLPAGQIGRLGTRHTRGIA